MKKLLSVFVLFAASVFAADINGKWAAETTGRDGEKRTQTFTFKADGDKLTGTMSAMGGEREIADGKISGDDISFSVKFNFNGNERTMNYTGKIVGDEIKLSTETPRGKREMTAKRVTS